MLGEEDLRNYREKYDADAAKYRSMSEHVITRCNQYKKDHPTQVRLVFSRDPPIKEWGSLIKKISDRRRKKPQYSYDDVEDFIGVTVLCPYKSDARDFIAWMHKSFNVCTPDVEAERNDPSGHRAYHYIVKAHNSVVIPFPNLEHVKCEIQIKTILEEAFDAKTHDLTYKPGEREVSPELRRQFAMLSTALGVVDQQSEFLKDLIIEEERAIDLRRKACVRLYLNDPEALKTASANKIDIDKITPREIQSIADKLSAAADNLSKELCKCAALCALNSNDEYLKGEAKRYSSLLIDKFPDEMEPYMVAATIKWALGYFEEAIHDVAKGIRLATTKIDDQSLKRAKNAFVYLVADWKSYGRKERSVWLEQASGYVEELSNEPENFAKDTIGYYWIVFGKTRKDIDRGRTLIRDAHPGEGDKYSYFFKYHEFVALRKLLATLELQ